MCAIFLPYYNLISTLDLTLIGKRDLAFSSTIVLVTRQLKEEAGSCSKLNILR